MTGSLVGSPRMSVQHANAGIGHRLSRACLLAAALLTFALSLGAGRVAAVPLACSWKTVTTPLTNNVAIPDTNAIYWTSKFTYEAGLEFQIAGTYPNSRYMSFNVYSGDGNSFTVQDAGQLFASSLPDFRIDPLPGNFNPFATPAPTGVPRGFALTLALNPAGIAGNVLPLAPLDMNAKPPVVPQPGQIGYFIMRVYLRDGAVDLIAHGVTRRQRHRLGREPGRRHRLPAQLHNALRQWFQHHIDRDADGRIDFYRMDGSVHRNRRVRGGDQRRNGGVGHVCAGRQRRQDPGYRRQQPVRRAD